MYKVLERKIFKFMIYEVQEVYEVKKKYVHNVQKKKEFLIKKLSKSRSAISRSTKHVHCIDIVMANFWCNPGLQERQSMT
ncbi:33105_t:CDS:2 [Gigaspora margarita]|uniref:33105_t:CDS:1 n=1 Tax=Gigaspora margarita TaxID=4874 RepID=A0ABN7UG14_GIGMA|nr:33105_t:CDS:2 [Gigaspora margarita]